MNTEDFDLPADAEQQIEQIEDELARLDRREEQLLEDALEIVQEHSRPA